MNEQGTERCTFIQKKKNSLDLTLLAFKVIYIWRRESRFSIVHQTRPIGIFIVFSLQLPQIV